MSHSYDVGVLGATGAVGQTFLRLLDGHPWFNVTALAASERSAGKPYREAANWIGDTPIPERFADAEVQNTEPGLKCDFVFSGLSSNVAGDVEKAFAEAGYPVISNAKNYRMQPVVPLLIPEVNPDHTVLIEQQKWREGGFIVTNPNCSSVGLVCALAPLSQQFNVQDVQVTTMQALSGAGYPGVSSLDALGNVVPFIGGEEDKMAEEPRKILGKMKDGAIEEAEMNVSAQCNRVPVLDGHIATVSIRFGERRSPAEVVRAFNEFPIPDEVKSLPSVPDQFIKVFHEQHFPQPRRHANLGGGMTVSVGRVRECPVQHVRFVVLVHNTVRGAAGGAILNAELLAEQGYFSRS